MMERLLLKFMESAKLGSDQLDSLHHDVKRSSAVTNDGRASSSSLEDQ
jgi:hypothetical protein